MQDPRFSAEFEKEFYSLYEKFKPQRFDPALQSLNHALKSLLDERCASSRTRLRVELGRVKTANRLLLKARLGKYAGKINSASEVFSKIRDLVGTRVTCNTTKDAYAVSDAVKSVLANRKAIAPLVKVCDDFEDDYVKSPKESGYRGLSITVGVPVVVGSSYEPVTCEIQIRTLLQDAWGELTHEDTYKPEMKVPRLIMILSKRLANALSVLDEIAQDIRDELDRVEVDAIRNEVALEDLSPNGSFDLLPTSEAEESIPLDATPPEGILPSPIAPTGVGDGFREEWIDSAFHVVYHRSPEMNDEDKERLAAYFGKSDLLTAVDLEQALKALAECATAAELSDMDILYHAPLFRRDPKAAERRIRSLLQKRAQKKRREEEFATLYSVNNEFLGTVVHVASDYALVQLPTGATGIVHVTSMKSTQAKFIDLRQILKAGETIKVQVIASDYRNARIELRQLNIPS